MTWVILLTRIYWVLLGIALLVQGCGTTPTCADNPRNMQCFSADELQKELNK